MNLFFIFNILFHLFSRVVAQSQCQPYYCLSGCCSSYDECSFYLNHSALRFCYLGNCDLMTCYSNECCYGGRCLHKSDPNCSSRMTNNLLIVVLAVLIPVLVIITLVVIIALCSRKKKKFHHSNPPIPLNFSYPIVPTLTERKRINPNAGNYNLERPPEFFRTCIPSSGQISYPNQFSYEDIVIGQIPSEMVQEEGQGNSYIPINHLYLTENTDHFQEEKADKTKQMRNFEGEKNN